MIHGGVLRCLVTQNIPVQQTTTPKQLPLERSLEDLIHKQARRHYWYEKLTAINPVAAKEIHRLPGAAYNYASTHAHVCLRWSWLSINDLQGYNFESLNPHLLSAAAPLSTARSSGVHIILLFFFNLHRNLLYDFCIVSTSICPSSRREHGIQAWPGCIYLEPQGQQSKPRLYMVQWAVSRTMKGCPEIGAGYPEFCLQGCRVG